MSSASDWIPTREQDFADLCERWVAIISDTAKQAQFGWTQTECAALAAVITRFLNARTAYHTDNSTENRLIKDEAKAEAAKGMRDFARTDVRNNKKMHDEDRLPLGILPADTTPTPHGPLSEEVEAESDSSVVRQLSVRYRVKGSASRAKPAHAHGVECAWAALDHQPASVAELSGRLTDTASPLTIPFTEADRGRRVYYCLRWVGTTEGHEGPWSEIFSAIVP